MGTKNLPVADAAGWVLPDNDERSGTLETVYLGVVVDGENLREAQALGGRHQRGVGEVHRSVLILFHQDRNSGDTIRIFLTSFRAPATRLARVGHWKETATKFGEDETDIQGYPQFPLVATSSLPTDSKSR